MGLTALHLAAWEAPDGPPIIQLLLLCGADKDMLDNEGMTPLDRARSRGRALCEDCIVNGGWRCFLRKASVGLGGNVAQQRGEA